jgi:hypothetical protein
MLFSVKWEMMCICVVQLLNVVFDGTLARVCGRITRSTMAAPLLTSGGELVGVMHAVNRQGGGAFTDHDASIMMHLAAQGTTLLHNALLYHVRSCPSVYFSYLIQVYSQTVFIFSRFFGWIPWLNSGQWPGL